MKVRFVLGYWVMMRGAKLWKIKFSQPKKSQPCGGPCAQTFPPPIFLPNIIPPQPQPIHKAGDISPSPSPSQPRIGCSTQLRFDTLINTQILTTYSQPPQKCRLQDLPLHTATHLPRLHHLRPIRMAILLQRLSPFTVVPTRLVRAPLAQVAVVDHELPPR
jgi:hypothetical protein